jgi:site-specific DNA-methyltransferase (adenine-specific)
MVAKVKGKVYDDLRNPSSVQYFNNRESSRGLHPTQKPLELLKYLVKTYTNESDIVLDNTMGSGTTCLAAKELNRKFIGIENDLKYYEISVNRIFGS